MRDEETRTTAIQLTIKGLRCAGCVTSVEAALKGVPGVANASVILATGRAAVVMASEINTPALAELTGSVKAAGYDAEIAAPEAGNEPEHRAERLAGIAREQRRILIATGIGAIVVLVRYLQESLVTATGVGPWPIWITEGTLTLAVMALAAGPMLMGAWRAILRLRGNMDLLVSLGASTAFTASVLGIVLGEPGMIMFEAAVMIVVFVAIGKYFETRSRGQASAALEALFNRIPREALRSVNGRLEKVPVADIQTGDRLQLAADTTVPVDGEVVGGQITIDEAMLTGEALPIDKSTGDFVFGGTTCVAGSAVIVAQATGENSAANRIANLIADAQATKTPWQRLADRIAGIFVPVILALALATFVGWLSLSDSGLLWATKRAIAVLVVACPCALGLAIPTAVLVGTAKAGERGILVRDPAAIEAAGHLREILLDKTGTLTLGRPTVTDVVPLDEWGDDDLLVHAASVERYSEHPLAKALVRHAVDRDLALKGVSGFASRAGGGVRGDVDGRDVVVGSAAYLVSNGVDGITGSSVADTLAPQGKTALWIASDGELRGVVALADQLHPESVRAIDRLKSLGIQPRILSGDREPAVARVARELGIERFDAELLPDEKLRQVSAAAASRAGVAMVGDGINDAAALAAADVGIAIGTGADVAREAADICLVGHSPQLIADAVELSRRCGRVMKQNLFWALIYNAIMLPVAIFTGIPPAAATAAMMLSSLSVVGNSLRLRSL